MTPKKDEENGGATADKIVKRVVLYVTAGMVVCTAFGAINKKFIADPITRAVAEERVARQATDSLIIVKLSLLGVRDLPTLRSDVGDAAEDSRTQAGRNLRAIQNVSAKLDTLLRRRR